MKKYFIFAAIATAGLFASCSSSDDVTSNDVQGSIEIPEGREAIRLNLATPTVMTTRGTGTVGGVGTNGQGTHYLKNEWKGQPINVFMFTKGTEAVEAQAATYYADVNEYNTAKNTTLTADEFAALDDDAKIKTPATQAAAANPYATTLNLTEAHEPGANAATYLYNNTEMITPGSSKNLIPGEKTDDDGIGEAMIKDGTINYYPPQGNFDFFGYHGDDAVDDDPEITKTATLWTVPFEINGTQDLMSTKAVLTETQTAKLTTGTGTEAVVSKDYYSAKAARKGVHPTLTFKHLLTRLQFGVIAGNKSAAGWVEATPAVNYSQAECDTHNAGLEGAVAATTTATDIYEFKAWIDGQGTAAAGPFYEGKVKSLGADGDGYTKVKVISNEVPSFIGNEYAVHATDLTGMTGSVELLTVTNHASLDPKIYVTGVDNAQLDAAEANAYNATLTDAWTTATVKTPAQDAHIDALQAVKVKKIEVLSANTTGKLSVAWTANELTDPNKITWDASQPDETNRWLTLMDRPEYQKKAGAAAAAVADFTDLQAMSDAIDAQIGLLDVTDDAELITTLTAKKTALGTEATNRETAKITAETYALLTADAKAAKYEEIENAVNEKLMALTPTSPTCTVTNSGQANETFDSDAVQVGESIILSPGAYDANGVAQTGDAATEKIRMKVTLVQNVPTNWNHPQILTEKTQEYELAIPKPTGGFLQNTSYNIKLTVYGLERIEVIAVVQPWVDGEDIDVGADD